MPHLTTGVSPAELLFKRKICTRLPELDPVTKAEIDEAVHSRTELKREMEKNQKLL